MEVEADWRGSKRAHECLDHLCLTENMSDVIFGFPDSTVKLHAHKFVLGMRSAVFEAMFYGPMAEKKQEITIEDSDPKTFKLFLRYVYSDAFDLDESTLLDCLYLGRKYCVEGLAQACLFFLETSVSPENICAIYEQACKFDMPDLHAKCLRLMADGADMILESEKFLDISNKTLTAFLNCGDLNVDEMSVFNGTVKWAKHQCATSEEDESPENIRKYIGDVLYSIRFPIIPTKTFAEKIGPCQLLTSEEEVKVYRFMATNADVDLDLESKVVGRFKAYKRKPNIDGVVFSNASANTSSSWIPKYDIIEFFISLSSRLKLYIVSDSKICDGVKCVIVNSMELMEDEWFSRDDELVFCGGTTLDDGMNSLVVITKNPQSHGFNYLYCGDSDERSEETFNILETNIRVNYGQSTGRRMTFGKLE